MKRSRDTFEQQQEDKNVTTWDNLNHDVLRCIALWLPYQALMAYVNVCKRTALIITDKNFWQEKTYHDFSSKLIVDMRIYYREERRLYLACRRMRMLQQLSTGNNSSRTYHTDEGLSLTLHVQDDTSRFWKR